MNIELENKFKNFVKELSDFAYAHKDGADSQFVSTQDALAAYYLITNIMIKSEADALLFLVANNLLNVYIKEPHAIKTIDYYFKNSIAIILYYANMNNFKNFHINFIDSELFNSNMIIFSIYDLQFSYHSMPYFIKTRIPIRYKSHELFNGVRHKSCISDLYHKVIENKHLFNNLTYRNEPLIEKAYEFASEHEHQSISKQKFRNMLPAYCFDYSQLDQSKINAIDRYGLEKYVGKRYIVSTHLKRAHDIFDKPLDYIKKNDGILVNLQSAADYLIVENLEDLTNEVKKINEHFVGKVLALNLENGTVTEIDSGTFLKLHKDAIEQKLKKDLNKKLRKSWRLLCAANLSKAEQEENKSKLVLISPTLTTNENDYNEAIELIESNGYIPCDKLSMISHVIVKDEEDQKRFSSLLEFPYSGLFISLSKTKK